LGNIEKYGVLALIFVIVLILAVAICNGPGDTAKEAPNGAGVSNVTNPPVPAGELGQRKNIADALRKMEEEKAKNNAQPGGGAGNGGVAANGAKAVDLNPSNNARDEKSGGVEKNPPFKTHIVKKDETLASIAKKELGASSKWVDLAKANEGLDPKKLKVGQSILVPVVDDLDMRESADAGNGAPIKAVKKNTKENAIAAKSTR
jgi:LysM repeat protein